MVDTIINTDFATHWERTSCYAAANLKRSLRCEFIKTVTNCTETFHYMEYIQFVDCFLKLTNHQLELIVAGLLIVVSVYLLVIIGLVADIFFAPALKKLSKLLRMNQHLAGITILSLCNSDLYLNMEIMDYPRPLFADCLGNCLFMITISSGLVAYTNSFEFNPHATVRDILFLVLSVLLIDYTIANDGYVSRLESLGQIAVYVVYILINIIELILLKKEYADMKKEHLFKVKKKRISSIEKLQMKAKKDFSTIDFIHSRRDSQRFSRSVRMSANANKRRSLKSTSFITYAQRRPDTIDEEATKYAVYSNFNTKNVYLYEEFFDSLKPFTTDAWYEGSKCMKFWLIISAPARFVTLLFIPIVDVEMDKHGWSKLLNCLQLVIFPLLLMLKPFGRAYALYVLAILLITVPLAIVVFFNTRTDCPPGYHCLFTFLACFNSIFLIYVISSWFALLLDIIGNSFILSYEFMGVTFSAWGTASGSVVTNVIVALHGYEKMAFAASYGAPILILLLSMGLRFCQVNWVKEAEFENIYDSDYEVCAFVFIMLTLGTTFFWITILNFQTRRSVGIFTIMIYIIFLMFAILSEKEVIHTFNRDPQFTVK